MYMAVPKLICLKLEAESKIIDLAVSELSFDFSLVFYDVTTLYFESFASDELRKPGFSKDNKSQQPQIVIGLVMSKDGFPVAYEVFEGNKFEGHTIIPIILNFQAKHRIKNLNQQLQEKDKATVRTETPHGDMICGFSSKRYAKDKREMEKQIKKAKFLLQKPSGMKRAKFVKSNNNAKYELNSKLVKKLSCF